MKKIFYVLIFSTILLATTQCSDSFVDLEQPSGKSLSTLFSDSKNTEKALTACYHTLWHNGVIKRGQILLGDSPSDNVKELGDAGGYGIATLQLNTFIFNNDNFLFDERWKDIYQGLYRINTFLDNVDNEDFNFEDLDTSIKNRWVGEAKVLRAYLYFTLVTNFGEVPLITEPLSPSETIGIEKNSIEEIWTQIELDLENAIPALPLSYDNSNVGRITKNAANALLGRAHLYQNEWNASIDATKKVVESTQYDLYDDDYANLFNGMAENSIESVWELQSFHNGGSVWDLADFGILTYYWCPNFAWAENFFGPSQSIIDAFAARPDDKRRVGSFYLVGANDSIDGNGDGIYETFPSESDNNRVNYINGGNVRKYLPAGINLANRSLYKINYNIIRYAEVLLNYAEALNESGQSDQALVYVNKIRTRAGMSDLTITDQSQLRDAIALERRLELCFEGHRFFDLKRTGKAQQVLGPQGYNQNSEYFPIPQSETMINDQL